MARPDANLFRTQVAASTNVFSSSFNAIFASMVLSPGGYVPEMTSPEGQSTGGGKLAGQKIRLVPKQQGFNNLVVGDANPALKHAELRSFQAVDEAHREHFKRPVPLDEREYAAFITKARNFFERQEMVVTTVLPSSDNPSDGSADGQQTGGNNGMLMGFLMGAAVAILAGFAFWYFRR